jgi:hypothetical protein
MFMHPLNMTSQTFTYFIFSFLLLTSCKSARKIQFGDYKARHDNTLITLRSDSTFKYYRSRHMNSITATGQYKMKSDTLFFLYTDKNYDSLVAAGQSYIPLSQALGLPKQYIWKRNKLLMPYGESKVTYAKHVQ